jgi:hypothetical protein
MIQGGFTVTVPITLMLYISYIDSIISSPQPLPKPLKAIARGFLVLFHIGTWSPSTIYPQLSLLSSPSPSHYYPTSCTHHAYFIVLVFINNIWVDVQRGVSMYALCAYALLWSVQSLWLLLFTPLSPTPPFFNIFQYTFLTSSTLTSCGMWYYWCSIVLFSLLSFHEFYRVVTLLQTGFTTEFVCDHVCVCVYVYLWIYLPWEKICVFCVSYPGLLHSTWCPSIVSSYLQTTCH